MSAPSPTVRAGADHRGVGRLRPVPPGRWALLKRPPHVIGYVLLIDLAAVTLTVLSLHTMTPDRGQWWHFGVLLTCGVLYTELSRGVERARRRYQATPHAVPDSVWTFAAVLLLPPGLTAIIIATVVTQRWFRVRHHVVHRRVFSAASMMLAAHAAVAVLNQLGFDPTARTLHNFAIVAAAALAFHGCQALFVGLAIFLTTRGPDRLRAAAGKLLDQVVEAASIGLGFLLAWAMLDWPIVGLVILGVTFTLHHVVLIRQLRDRARTDAKTGLLNIDGFGELARREIARTSRHSGRQIALLLIDIDHFKKINDTHGHPAGDEVLLATARTLTAEVRLYDVVGRYGGEEFVILLPDTTATEAVGVAERIRRRINDLAVAIRSRSRATTLSGLTASIGIAVYPLHGADLDQLIQAADGAMYRAKHAGRDRTALAHPTAEPVTEPLDFLTA